MLVNEVGQNSKANTANPITISDLDDPKEQEKIQKESSEQSEIMRLNGSLSSSKNA